jgi:hypothetical protein
MSKAKDLSNVPTNPTGFRNAIINGDFRVNQRSLTSSGITGNVTYGFDRWMNAVSGGTATMSAQTFAVGSPVAPGYEAQNFLRQVVSGQSAVGNYASVIQYIEDVRTYAGTAVTISFWAKAGSGTPKIAVEFQQQFGSGGSPSGTVFTNAGQVTLSTSWARYSVTATVPSISGKTIGTTANTSTLVLNLWTSAGSDYNSRSGSLGIQNNTFDIWGVQVERGTVATPFEQRSIGTELNLCQRYYRRWSVQGQNFGYSSLGHMVAGGNSSAETATQLSPTMRVVPHTLDSLNIGAYRYAGQVIPSAGTLSIVNPPNDLQGVMIRWSTVAGAFATAETVLLIGSSSPSFVGVSAEF